MVSPNVLVVMFVVVLNKPHSKTITTTVQPFVGKFTDINDLLKLYSNLVLYNNYEFNAMLNQNLCISGCLYI